MDSCRRPAGGQVFLLLPSFCRVKAAVWGPAGRGAFHRLPNSLSLWARLPPPSQVLSLTPNPFVLPAPALPPTEATLPWAISRETATASANTESSPGEDDSSHWPPVPPRTPSASQRGWAPVLQQGKLRSVTCTGSPSEFVLTPPLHSPGLGPTGSSLQWGPCSRISGAVGPTGRLRELPS